MFRLTRNIYFLLIPVLLFAGCSRQPVILKGKVYYGEKNADGILVKGPLEGAKVKEEEHDSTVTTSADGSFLLEIKVPRTIGYASNRTFTVEAWGDVPSSLNPSVTTTANEEITVKARPGESVEMRNFLLYRHEEED
ncbi:MAG: hypothetical protein PF545_03500 [Elusimicrobia bacterium]|jgi:hypothetical protein|nr:hypothetical protein [Elusimicrobiota bacterium]